MSRLIDAEKIDFKGVCGSTAIRKLFEKVIDEQPTVDAVEVVHGEWELIDSQHIEKVYLCTACENYEAWGEYEKTRYCPNCGAKMDGGDKE